LTRATARRPDAPAAALDLDPFSEPFLADPYPFHEQIREAGPVVRLSRYGVWASARFGEVQQALQDWRQFSSASGVGLADFRKETPWRPPSLVLEADPPLHSRTRPVLARALGPAVLKGLQASFEGAAQSLIEPLIARGRFDAVTELAELLPIGVFADALGLAQAGREHLLPYAATVFNAFGPRNALLEDSLARAQAARAWVGEQCARSALAPGSIGAAVFEAADRGEVTEAEAGLLFRSLLSAGLDTTVHGIANALYALASHPDQWRRLSAEPSLARNAFEEALRLESPVQTFFRTTACEVELGGVRLPAGEKILLFLGAANRDPRRWERPDDFDIDRRAGGHVGFGSGIHGCVGQMVARLEGEVVLTALARRARSLELCGEPVWKPNNTLRGLSSLPLQAG
jgi:cytochrome P450